MTTYLNILKETEGLVETRYGYLAADMDSILGDSTWGAESDDTLEFDPKTRTFRYYGIDITKETFLDAIKEIKIKIDNEGIDRVMNSESDTVITMNNIEYCLNVREGERTIFIKEFPTIGHVIKSRRELVEFFNEAFDLIDKSFTNEALIELLDERLYEWDEYTWNDSHGFVVYETNDYRAEKISDSDMDGYIIYDKLKNEGHLLYESLLKKDIFDRLASHKFFKKYMTPSDFYHMKGRFNITTLQKYEKESE